MLYVPIDLINLSAPANAASGLQSTKGMKRMDEKSTDGSQWYDIFADLDPIANPDSLGKKEGEEKEIDNRYC